MTTPTPSLFTASDYRRLAAIVFRPDYPGNATARGVVEAPNGDSAARDTGKRYAHVATKYLTRYDSAGATEHELLRFMLDRAYARAVQVAKVLGVPEAFMPSFEHGALRVLEYPPGATSAVHTDMDLFTLNLWRDRPEGLVRFDHATDPCGNDLGNEVHLGELGELLGCGRATQHAVNPVWHEAAWYQEVSPGYAPQHSIVYFVIPDHAAVLPRNKCRYWNGDDVTVGEWLKERMARSRYAATEKGYE